MKNKTLLLSLLGLIMSTATVYSAILNPDSIIATFDGHKPNCIDDPQFLNPFFKKLNASQNQKETGSSNANSPKILLIGDSHIAGKVFPNQFKDSLSQEWEFQFESYSKIGVQLNYFLKDEQMNSILAYKPDLLIVALGTNEADQDDFSTEKYTQLIQKFYDRVMSGTDSTTTILFTTAPGAYKKKYGANRKSYVRVNNTRNKVVADCQAAFCKAHNISIWNLLNIAGGEIAAENWKKAKLMEPDSVHYTKNGYTIQAHLLVSALIDAKRIYDESMK